MLSTFFWCTKNVINKYVEKIITFNPHSDPLSKMTRFKGRVLKASQQSATVIIV